MKKEGERLTFDQELPYIFSMLANGTYHITIKNEHDAKKGVKELIVNGKKVEGDIIPVSSDAEVDVVAIM